MILLQLIEAMTRNSALLTPWYGGILLDIISLSRSLRGFLAGFLSWSNFSLPPSTSTHLLILPPSIPCFMSVRGYCEHPPTSLSACRIFANLLADKIVVLLTNTLSSFPHSPPPSCWNITHFCLICPKQILPDFRVSYHHRYHL